MVSWAPSSFSKKSASSEIRKAEFKELLANKRHLSPVKAPDQIEGIDPRVEVLNRDPAEKAGLVQPSILVAPAKKRDY